MDRKTLLTIVTVTAVVLLGLGAYFYFKKDTLGGTSSGEFPFSSGGPGGQGGVPDEEDDANIIFQPGQSLPKLYELHRAPVAGVGFHEIENNGVSETHVRYIERGLGHIYQTNLNTYEELRIINETRSRVSEAFWGNNAQSLITRVLDQNNPSLIKTSILNLGTPTTEIVGESYVAQTEVEEIALPDNIPFLSVSEDNTDKLFYLQNDRVSAKGTTISFMNKDPASIFNSPFTEWLPQFPNQKLLTLTTRPSSGIPGYLFFVEPATKSLIKILDSIDGLTTLTNYTGTKVLYSSSKERQLDLFVHDVAKKTVGTIPLNTLPEKCVWSKTENTLVYCAIPKTLPSGNYPDQWYQGFISFSDDIWKINTETIQAEKILDPSVFEAKDLDIINPSMSSGDRYMVFMNKNTGTPWVYRLIDELPPAQTSEPISQTSEPTTQEVSTGTTSSTTEGMTQVR